MKRLSNILFATMTVVLFSCGGEKAAEKETTGGFTSKQKEMLEANHAVQRAIETGDSATLRKYMTDESVDHGGGPDGKDLKGAEVVRMLSSVHNDIDNLKFEVLQEAANDDHIFSLVHMTGTTNKAVWGMPKGHKVDSKSIDVIKVKDDLKMTDHWAYFDMAEMSKMMGGGQPAAPATPAAEKL